MGIAFHPIVQGEIDGEKDGLISDLSIFEFAQGFAFEKFSSDYWIGFGAGYIKGQAIRTRLKMNDSPLSFDEKIACCQYLFSKIIICKIKSEHYLENIQNWDNFKIDLCIAQTALRFLESRKIQRAVDEIFSFYKENFRLKALKEFDRLYQDLKNIRNEKRKLNNYDTSKAKAKIELDLYEWLNKNSVKDQ